MAPTVVPYLPRLVVDWMGRCPDQTARSIDGTLVFADISGFTALTEKLGRRGRAGAEEMGEILNSVFARLLADAYGYGATLLKWGGDATLLLFDGAGHEQRACRAAWEMQRTIRRIGRLRTSCGTVTLRMSIGVHSGAIDAFLVGERHRELIVAGPAATATARAEQVATAGQIALSAATAAALPAGVTDPFPGVESLRLLVRRPQTASQPAPAVEADPDAELSCCLPLAVARHVSGGAVEPQHRFVSTAFIRVSGTDELIAGGRSGAASTALAQVVDATAAAADRHGVTFLASDLAPDGAKLILVAGAPESLGESVDRVLCAVTEVLATPTALELRAGVERGWVFAGDFGPPYRRTYSVVGDSVNVAARLMGAAGNRELLTTPEVLGFASQSFPHEVLSLELKGKSAPVSAARIIGPPRPRGRGAGSRLPLAGRDDEMARLIDAGRACATGRGEAIVIAGERGIGKSRLVDEFVDRSEVSVRLVHCDLYGSTEPYGPISRLIRELVDLGGGRDPTERGRRLRQITATRFPYLAPWMPLVGAALGVAVPATHEVDALQPEFRPAKLAATVVGLLDAVAAGPTAFCIDDVHFADSGTVEVVAALCEAAAERPWLVLVTSRPGGPVLPAATLHLEPLGAGPAAALLQAVSEELPLTTHEFRDLLDKAGGNPLYIEELARAQAGRGATETLPDTIEEVVAAQIDRQPAAVRRVLRAAAVLGIRAARADIERMIVEGGDIADGAAWDAAAAYLAPDGDEVSFRHALVREVAYESLPYQRRRALHATAAGVIADRCRIDGADRAGLLSLHCFEAGQFEAALDHSVRAAQRARETFAPVEAARMAARALDCVLRLGASPATVAPVAVDSGEAWFAIADFDRAERAFRLAHRLVPCAETALLMADVLIATGRLRLAARWLRSGLREPDLGVAAEAQLKTKLAFVRWQEGRISAALRDGDDAIAVARRSGDPECLARSYQVRDLVSLSQGDFAGPDLARAALAIYRRRGKRPPQAYLLNQMAMRAYYRGRWDEALARYGQARVILEEIGDDFRALDVGANESEILLEQGRLTESEQRTRDALRAFRAAGARQRIGWATSQLGSVLTRQGRLTEAMEVLSAARELCATEADLAATDARVAECLLAAGDLGPALAEIDAILRRPGEGAAMVRGVLRRLRALALWRTGDYDGARREIRNALAEGRERGALHEVALALDAMTHDFGMATTATVRERDRLFARLGIVAVPDPSMAAGRPTVGAPPPVAAEARAG